MCAKRENTPKSIRSIANKFNVTEFSDDKGLTSSIDIVVNYLEHVFIFLLSANEHQELKL